MATISSLGIGSGLDVNSIISQLVALEKQPLQLLSTQATSINSKISAVGSIQSQYSSLATLATSLSDPTAWQAATATSSNTAAATISVTSSATPTSLSVNVDQLAQVQSVTSAGVATTTSSGVSTQGTVGAGTMTIQLGTWSGTASGSSPSFAAASGSSAVSISVSATDTVASLAAKINAANAGVVATDFFDGTSDHLQLSSQQTGAASGFRVQTTPTAASNLSMMAFDPQTNPTGGMAANTASTQYAQDANVRINGLAVTSSSNTLSGNIPGVTIQLQATTTTGYGTASQVNAPISMVVSEDTSTAISNVNNFVNAYNSLNSTLRALTNYDPSTKTGSLFQGDSVILGMQNSLLAMESSSTTTGGAYSLLSDIGVSRQLDGSLTVDTTKLTAAANNGTELQKLFTTATGNSATEGVALKFADYANGALASSGAVTDEQTALQQELTDNTNQQAQVNDHVDAVAASLTKTYSALDGTMASLNALSAYVSQQVTSWNKASS